MKFNLKTVFSLFVLSIILFMSSNVFAETGRFVDIPVPPNSTGYADYTEEEAEEREEEYEKNKENDTYTIYVKDDTINTFNVTAEADDENAKIDGTGMVTVSSKERFINITVTAENGNINVYTINIDNVENKKKDFNFMTIIIIVIVVLIAIFIISRILKNKKKSRPIRRH